MKALVTHYYALEIMQLCREGWMHPASKCDWVWRTGKGSQLATVKIIVHESTLELWFPLGSSRALQRVLLVYSAGPHGGKRPWFACPNCQQRVGILYHLPAHPFLCRRCYGLAYPTQYPSRRRSYGRRCRSISQSTQRTLKGSA